MAITSVTIHPAVGIARLGNSPDDFFVGPERPWEPADPPGGFKDGQCRVKRQAARFRVFAFHDDGTVQELTADDAAITWTVQLVNKKAVLRNGAAPAGDMTIDPGPETLDGPDQRKLFDSGQIKFPSAAAVDVPLGEARTDDAGRLLVLGGFGTSATPTGAPIVHFADNPGWYDDASDGPVTAHVKLNGSGDEFDATGAWVIVGPPKFAPQLDSPITLYDAVFQMAVDQGWLAGPATPSYTNDVFPILESARTIRWVFELYSAHTWADPVYDPGVRQGIFNRLANPNGGGSNMPMLQQATLTKAQYAVMEKWKDDAFTRDWAGPPAPAPLSPEGLDRAALANCVGAAFFPGIEAGGLGTQPIVDPAKHVGASDPLRLAHAALAAGDMTQRMAVPWQADFMACGYMWWPVPRPNDVIPQGTSSYLAWDRDVVDMVNEWHTLGFVVAQGSEYVEVDRCDTSFITLVTPHLTFQDVPQGPMGMSRKAALAIAFEVRSTGSAVTLEVQPGDGPAHPRLTLSATADTVGPTAGNEIATARLWLIYETGAVGETITDDVTVRHVASGQSWTITVSANTVGRKVAAAALVLDRSGSMSEDRGDGQSKHQSLKEAASIFVDVMLEGDGVGLVRYDQNAQPVQPVTALGPPGDPFGSRQTTKDLINGPSFAPAGATSIGDGIFEGRQLLSAAGAGYDVKSLVVLTDGKENQPRWISDVAAQINELTYSVGLGTPQNTSAPALQTISGNNGGYLLVTGAITGDNRFILQKYFLQILAGISSAEVVLDPDGALVRGQEQRIPFQLSEADAGVDVILLTESPQSVDFRLQTPNGFILEPWRAMAEQSMSWSLSDGVAYYRLVLPAELFTARYDQPGTWHALLRIGKPRLSRPDDVEGRPDQPPGFTRRIPPRGELEPGPRRAFAGAAAAADPSGRGRLLPYSLLVHTYSSLSLRATVNQSGFEPGATVSLEATLAESGVPLQRAATVWAEIARPDGTVATIGLAEEDPGRYVTTFGTSASGVYRCRVRASGRTRSGYPFQREQTVTAMVWQGGSRDADPDRTSDEAGERLCRLLSCLLGKGGVLTPELERRLSEAGVDVARLRRCLAELCRPRRPEEGIERADVARLAAGLLEADDG